MKKWKVWVDSADATRPDVRYFAKFKEADDYFWSLRDTWMWEARLEKV